VINAYPKEHQLLLLMEELSELVQATSKLVRYGEMEPFLEEFTDVEVMLEEMRQMYHIDEEEVNKRAEKKLWRALEGVCVITKKY
jgi:cell fate (sporulation/competence/biofilm development) regulator YlbF (YheA/YmcA/DUF963 family)